MRRQPRLASDHSKPETLARLMDKSPHRERAPEAGRVDPHEPHDSVGGPDRAANLPRKWAGGIVDRLTSGREVQVHPELASQPGQTQTP